MPSWWGKYSSKGVKRKGSKRSFIDAIHRKLIGDSESKKCNSLGGSERFSIDNVSEKDLTLSISALTSVQLSRCPSFVEESYAQPLPPPGLQLLSKEHESPDDNISGMELLASFESVPFSPPSRHEYDKDNPHASDTWGDLATVSLCSNSSVETDDQSDNENGNETAMNSPLRKRNKNQSPNVHWNPKNLPSNNQFPLTSTKCRGSMSVPVSKLHIPPRTGFFSAPNTSVSSPRNTSIACNHENVVNSSLCLGTPCSDMNWVGSCTSAHNTIGRDLPIFYPQSRSTPELSPIPSPKMTSPGRGSWIHGGGMIPVHTQAGGLSCKFSLDKAEDGLPQSHRLPLPPIKVPTSSSFMPSHSSVNTPTLPKNPGQADCSLASVSCWKKGRLIGRGTFGHVYVGFNSKTGEMCAMKEVTLFSDDAKSKESMHQLEQEISLLSCIRHHNIVRYLGSEMVDDKLYIYLEYVSGGSINKVLQEYGKLGESVIRSYTQQILSGLAYLHAKNTVHRDIKGANVLVDPKGRVKLADFGMAKHISGKSCPLSFKGSPYWMAPEVIKNPSGCTLAVDIWSLGCTVIEMATAKPPWSQYEGVAALFKIGNSKELPDIPEHISEEGKDFVRLCLKRNPFDRPTAIQLLEHPFVRNVSALPGRSLNSSKSSDASCTVSVAERRKYTGHAKMFSGVADVQLSSGYQISSGFSDLRMPKHLSCPVSPIGSPLLRPKSSQPTFSRRRSSILFTPQSASGPSTPHVGGNGALPMHHFNHSRAYSSYEGVGVHPPHINLHVNGTSLHPLPKPQALHGVPNIYDVQFTGQSVCK